jgi:hypothetical protein
VFFGYGFNSVPIDPNIFKFTHIGFNLCRHIFIVAIVLIDFYDCSPPIFT